MRALWLGVLLALLWAGLAGAQDAPERDRVEEVLRELEQLERQMDTRDPVFGQGDPRVDPDLREVIERFDVDIAVERSGDVVVTETITVMAAGREIRRGIFRELPAFYTYLGVRRAYDYELLDITRDGEPENVFVQRNGNALVWRIGRRDVLLRPGRYTYRIRYRFADGIRRLDDADELYWNATGSYWAFPIQAGRVTVRFPDGAEFRELNAYAGPFGEASRAVAVRRSGTVAEFELEEPLGRREGLTVSAIVEKGVIDPLSAEELAEFWWLRHGAAVLLGLGGLGLFGYYLLQWMRIGRDPPRPPVFARYAPPDGYGPAAVHYIHNRRHKGMTALSAELLGLGTAGVVEIDAQKDSTTVARTGRAATGDGQALLSAMMDSGQTRLVLDGEPNSAVHQGALDFLSAIAKRYGRDYYRRNIGAAVLGVVASIALVAFVLSRDVASNSPLVMLLLLGVAALNVVFLRIMPAPTKKGSRVHSEIEGFKLFLETAEADRINTGGPLQEQPPMMSVELYERFLPYALALGVERNWTKYFKSVLPREAADYRPSYARGPMVHGTGRRGGPIDFGRTLDKALTSGVAAAAPVSQSSSSSGGGLSGSSGWSSGGGGGGFSGGGFGGGGGGGW